MVNKRLVPSLPSPGIGEVTRDLIYHCSEQYTVVQTNVQVELTLNSGFTVPPLGTAHFA